MKLWLMGQGFAGGAAVEGVREGWARLRGMEGFEASVRQNAERQVQRREAKAL